MSDNYGAYCKKCQVRSPACCGLCTVCIAELEAENAKLKEALKDAIDGYEECAQYKGDYLFNKHGDAEEIARLKAAQEAGK